MSRRITIVQYAGDFREAAQRLADGGAETYRAQRYTVEFVHALAAQNECVTTITGFTQTPYSAQLSSGARAVGAGFTDHWDNRTMIRLINESRPTHIVLRTPKVSVLRAIARSGVPTIAMLADSFDDRTLRDRIRRFLTVRYLNAPCIQRIGNHGRASTDQLVRAGVHRGKVSAWDYPATDTPAARVPKSRPRAQRVIYVGMLSEQKGVDDLLHATALAKSTFPKLQVELVGTGDEQRLRALARSLGLADAVEFAGKLPNHAVIARMNASDIVVVPSRHSYPEGLPLTIYEAFCSRTPLITSDHPMFRDAVKANFSALVFRSGDPRHLSQKLRALLGDDGMYAELSRNALPAWEGIQIKQTWGEMITQWLEESKASSLTSNGQRTPS